MKVFRYTVGSQILIILVTRVPTVLSQQIAVLRLVNTFVLLLIYLSFIPRSQSFQERDVGELNVLSSPMFIL